MLYEHFKYVSDQESARYNILEEKAGKLFIVYNAMLALLLVIGKNILFIKLSIETSLWELLAGISLIFTLYFISKGIFYVIKVFKAREIEVPCLKEGAIYFFEHNENKEKDIIDFYRSNLKPFFKIFEKNSENNSKKAQNLKKSYKYLKKSYIAGLIFVFILLIDFMCVA